VCVLPRDKAIVGFIALQRAAQIVGVTPIVSELLAASIQSQS